MPAGGISLPSAVAAKCSDKRLTVPAAAEVARTSRRVGDVADMTFSLLRCAYGSIGKRRTDAPSVKVNLLDNGVVFTFVLVELAGCHPPGNRHYGTMDVRIGVAHAPRGYRERIATEIDLGRLLDVLPAMVAHRLSADAGANTLGLVG